MNSLFLAMILGILLGSVLVYVGATNSKELLNMLRFQDLRLMKTIVLGIGVAGFLLNISLFLGIIPDSSLSIKTMNLAVILGGIIFGVGFGYGGICPGTCIAGSLSKYALFAVLGGLIGAITFSYVYPFLVDMGLYQDVFGGKLTLFPLTEKYPNVINWNIGGILISILMMVIAYALPQKLKNRSN